MDMSGFLVKLNVQGGGGKGFFLKKWYLMGKKRKRASHGENKGKHFLERNSLWMTLGIVTNNREETDMAKAQWEKEREWADWRRRQELDDKDLQIRVKNLVLSSKWWQDFEKSMC